MNLHVMSVFMFQLQSSAFAQGQPIPVEYSGRGEDVSPELSWSQKPANTKSFVLLVDDPDAPTKKWTHWVVYNIPESVSLLPKAISRDESLPNGAAQGRNDFGEIGYGGPNPPSGTHRYFFKLSALDTTLQFSTTPSQAEVEKAMERNILEKTELMGIFTH